MTINSIIQVSENTLDSITALLPAIDQGKVGILPIFFYGVLFGIIFSVPLGPMGIFCLQRTLSKGLRCGIASVTGMGLADGFYIIVAGLGVGIFQKFVADQISWLKVVGIAIFFLVAIRMIVPLQKKPKGIKTKSANYGIFGSFFSAFAMQLSNPTAFILFLGLFSILNLAVEGKESAGNHIVPMVAGNIVGILSWWIGLCSLVSYYGEKISERKIRTVKRISGWVIITILVIMAFNLKNIQI